MPDKHGPSQDPLNLEPVDRDIRINELQERLTGAGATFGVSADCPPEAHEEFLRTMAHFEDGPRGSRFGQLTGAGIALPAPESLDDAALSSKLWEVIRALARVDVFLHHTDHLSDRALYEHLWHGSLREKTTLMPPGSGWMNHIDLIGGGSDEDIDIGLRYYDDEEMRGHWARDFPKMVIPPHENPPYDRDRLLPRPPGEGPEPDEDEDQ